MFSLWTVAATEWPLPESGAAITPRYNEFLQFPEVHRLMVFWGILSGLLVLTRILSMWLSSKAVAGEHSTLPNAVKSCVSFMVLNLVSIVGLGFCGFYFISQPQGWQPIVALGGAVLLIICVTFLIPMNIYQIGFLQTLGFLILTGIIQGLLAQGLLFGAKNYYHFEADLKKVLELPGTAKSEQQAFIQRLAGLSASDEIDRLLDRAASTSLSVSQADREATIRTIQQKLEARRAHASPMDPAGNVAFRWQLNRYLGLLEDAKAQRGGQQQAASAH